MVYSKDCNLEDGEGKDVWWNIKVIDNTFKLLKARQSVEWTKYFK